MTEQPISLKLQPDCSLIAREEPTERILEIAVTAPPSRKAAQRMPLNLALVIDRSGSMHGEKLDSACQAAAHIVAALAETDFASLVVYDDRVDLLCPSLPVTAEHRSRLLEQIKSIRSGGSTDLGGGWLRGCQEIARTAKNGQLVRALLLTDGLANVGIVDPEELAVHARELFARGISTSTFGIGLDFNEHLLEAMANQGGGNFYYIESPSQITDIFNRELQDLLAITARAVEVHLDLPAGVSAQVLGSWRHDASGGKKQINLGDLNQGLTREVYVKLIFPPSAGSEPMKLSAKVMARGEQEEVLTAEAEISFTPASADEVRKAVRSQELLSRFALVYLGDVATRALKLERDGKRDAARRLLEPALQEFGDFIDHDIRMRYEQISAAMPFGLDENVRKSTHYDSYMLKQRRSDPNRKH